MKIQNQILLSILPIVIMTVVSVTAVSIYTSTNVIHNQARDNIVLVNKSYSDQINSKLSILKSMARDLSLAVDTAINIEDVLINTNRRNSEISKIQYTNSEGKVVDMSPFNNEEYFLDISNDQDWIKAVTSKDTVISKPLLLDGEEVLKIFSPVIVDYVEGSTDKVIGVTVIYIQSDYVFGTLDSIDDVKNIVPFIMDSRGDIIINRTSLFNISKPGSENLTLANLKMIEDSMINQKSGVGSFYINNERMLISFNPISETKWSMGVLSTYRDLIGNIYRVVFISGVILLAGLVLSSVLIYIVIHGVTNPLRRLTVISNKISMGNLSIRSNFNQKNELGILSRSFDSMVDKLNNYNKNLEIEVENRTKELVDMNQELELTNKILDTNAQELEMLNEELQVSNETLDTNAREMEAMNEELRVSNENIDSVNKELIKTVDELEVTKNALWGEMELATKIQTILLPNSLEISGFEVSAFMQTANNVGGDYYDLLNINGRSWFLIGDVSGHGVSAGLIMMMVQTAIHTALLQNPDISPESILKTVNNVIHNNISRLGDRRYMTLTIFTIVDNKILYSGAHLPLIVYRSENKDIEFIETDGAWIGLVDNIDDLNSTSELVLNSGDSLLLYTDGICEAITSEGKLYSQKSLSKLFKDSIESSANDICKIIKDETRKLNVDDDITIMVLKKV